MQTLHCTCLHEIENKLPRTRHCFMPCEAQRQILKQRNMETLQVLPPNNYVFPLDKYGQSALWAYNEVVRAKKKYRDDFNSTHEGFAVLKEEVDELWDDIKKDRIAESVEEAVQVAAMALRYIAEISLKLKK